MSSSSSSSSRYNMPQHAPPSPPSAPQRPAAGHFLFVPSTLGLSAPTSAAPAEQHYIYGFSSPLSAVVAGSLPASSLSTAQQRLDAVLGDVGKDVVILGRLKHDEGKGKGRASAEEGDNFLLHLSLAGPRLVEGSKRTTLVVYTPPNRAQLQFLSLVPLPLDLNSFSSGDGNGDAAVKEDDEAQKTEDEVLSEKLKQSRELDFSAAERPKEGQLADLEKVVEWINLSPHIASLLSPSPAAPSLRSFSVPLLLSTTLKAPLQLLALLTRLLLRLTNLPLPFFLPGLGGMALKDLSATLQQVDTRLSQGVGWKGQWGLIRRTLDASARGAEGEQGGEGMALGRAHYIQFYNTMWLIANDIIVGSAFTSFVCENSDYLGETLGAFVQDYTLTTLRDLLLWLNDWPGGVKLNYELASIFCDGFLWGTGLWEEVVLKPLLPHLPTIVYLLGLSGLLGTTMFFSLASDLLSLLTAHIFVFYLMATSLFRWHLSMLGALFNIFRGKKFNVLRKRVEPAVYEVDQLLLGTILFTLAAFLFPTVLVYYLAFAASRLGIVVMHAGMEAGLAFMNHFPLFAVMLRFKDPARLPGGLQFELQPSESSAEPPVLRMTNNPIQLAGIFFAHLQLSRRLASHYSPIYLLGRLFTGRVISPIPRVRLRLDVASNVNEK